MITSQNEGVNKMEKKRSWPPSLLLAIAAGILLAAVSYVSYNVYEAWKRSKLADDSFKPQMSVSADQIRGIAKAIETYEKNHTFRPERLEELVMDGLIKAADLFDENRKSIPSVESKTGRFEINPDVLYFPALRKNDPGDLVLLCTVLLRTENEKFHVVTNDGKYKQLLPRELVAELQKTYTYLGGIIQSQSPAKPPAITSPPPD